MARVDLNEMESRLYDTVKRHEQSVDALYSEFNRRNAARAKEKEQWIRNTGNRNRMIEIGILVVGAVVAFLYYKLIFGIF